MAAANALHFDNALFPPFGKVKPEDVEPGMKLHLEQANERFKALEALIEKKLQEGGVTYADIALEAEALDDVLSRAWSTVRHLKSVDDSEPLRAAVTAMEPKMTEFNLEMAQSEILYKGWKYVSENHQLTPSQKRIVSKEILDAELNGIGLQGEAREKFKANTKRLADLKTKFANNLQDATKAFKLLLKDKKEVDGLPPSALALAAQSAQGEGHEGATAEEGPWNFTLDIPSYLPVMQHAKDRGLRERMYRAYLTRASEFSTDLVDDEGKVKDNTPVMQEILQLKQENAKLLGYDNFAMKSMAKKMATLDSALKLVDDLRGASYAEGQKELADLTAYAKEKGFEHDALMQWDVPFWAERLKEDKYAFNEEELKPYFALPNVEAGLFALAQKLFDVEIKRLEEADLARLEISLWHPDVRVFEVKRQGATVAYFYFDPYSRPKTKRGGAWMSDVAGRTANPKLVKSGASLRLPVAHMVCNQSPPVGDQPSLMTFREVETIFHEFGHAMQHMLTQETEGQAAGINNIEWDAVEQPSQFMENWCYDKATVDGMARHYQTQEPIPDELWSKVKAAKTYRAASMMIRQLHFAYVDLQLHANYNPDFSCNGGKTVWAVDKEASDKFDVIPIQSYDRFLCSFAHIFAGGYSAGYFSYIWAEVLSADCFAAFEEVGLENTDKVKETGKRFADTILALGGGVEPLEVFKRFRGREPTVDALLRHNDLKLQSAP